MVEPLMNAKAHQSPESVVREIRRNAMRKYSTEEKIRIVLEGLRGEVSRKRAKSLSIIL